MNKVWLVWLMWIGPVDFDIPDISYPTEKDCLEAQAEIVQQLADLAENQGYTSYRVRGGCVQSVK